MIVNAKLFIAFKSLNQLTFNHDHIDINSADGRLRKSFSLFKQFRYITCPDVFVGSLPVCKQLPHGHAETPHVALVREDAVLHALESQPFDWHLKN